MGAWSWWAGRMRGETGVEDERPQCGRGNKRLSLSFVIYVGLVTLWIYEWAIAYGTLSRSHVPSAYLLT